MVKTTAMADCRLGVHIYTRVIKRVPTAVGWQRCQSSQKSVGRKQLKRTKQNLPFSNLANFDNPFPKCVFISGTALLPYIDIVFRNTYQPTYLQVAIVALTIHLYTLVIYL